MVEIECSLCDQAHRLVGDLRQISNVRFGQCWNTTTRRPQNSNVFTSFTRTFWYTNEGRGITITYLDTLIDATFNTMENIYVELQKDNVPAVAKLRYAQLLKDLKTEILNSQSGILNLKGVYHDDEITKLDISKRIATIKEKYESIQQTYVLAEIHVPYYSPRILPSNDNGDD